MHNLIIPMVKMSHDYTIKTICLYSSQSNPQSQLFAFDNKLTSAESVIHARFISAWVRLKQVLWCHYSMNWAKKELPKIERSSQNPGQLFLLVLSSAPQPQPYACITTQHPCHGLAAMTVAVASHAPARTRATGIFSLLDCQLFRSAMTSYLATYLLSTN